MHIHVADTGIGIPPNSLSRVGDPFFQVRADYDRGFEGAGLGLSLVRGLIGLHGGALRLESVAGVGTRVTARALRLPLERSPAAPAAAQLETASVSATAARRARPARARRRRLPEASARMRHDAGSLRARSSGPAQRTPGSARCDVARLRAMPCARIRRRRAGGRVDRIVVNALTLQHERHPAPFFAARPPAVEPPPRRRCAAASSGQSGQFDQRRGAAADTAGQSRRRRANSKITKSGSLDVACSKLLVIPK